MVPTRLKSSLLALVAIAPFVIVATACSRPPEQQFLTQFFRAAKARDNTTLALMSAASFDPREQGAVEDFTIATVSEEKKTPLNLKALVEAEQKARDAEKEFAARKKVYQDENLETIEQVLKLERDTKAKLSPAQQAVKTAWDTWRAETGQFAKAVSDARAALSAASGPAKASLTQPGQPDFVAQDFEGDLVSKDVVVDAQVVSPEGQQAPRKLTVTLERVVGTLKGQAREGRWIITKIAGA